MNAVPKAAEEKKAVGIWIRVSTEDQARAATILFCSFHDANCHAVTNEMHDAGLDHRLREYRRNRF